MHPVFNYTVQAKLGYNDPTYRTGFGVYFVKKLEHMFRFGSLCQDMYSTRYADEQ